jgi:hypothetical protein
MGVCGFGRPSCRPRGKEAVQKTFGEGVTSECEGGAE